MSVVDRAVARPARDGRRRAQLPATTGALLLLARRGRWRLLRTAVPSLGRSLLPVLAPVGASAVALRLRRSAVLAGLRPRAASAAAGLGARRFRAGRLAAVGLATRLGAGTGLRPARLGGPGLRAPTLSTGLRPAAATRPTAAAAGALAPVAQVL